MTDIKTRLAQVDHLDPPSDLWEASTTRVPGPDRPLPSGVQTGWRKAAVIAVAFAVFGAAVLFAWSVLDVEPEPPTPPAPASDPFESLPAGWTELPEPPEIRCCSAHAWTGSELLIWGGHVGFRPTSRSTPGGATTPRPGSGDRCPPRRSVPARRRWACGPGASCSCGAVPTSAPTTPTPRLRRRRSVRPRDRSLAHAAAAPIDGRQPLAVWTGEEMIVWGSTDREQRRVDGAAYDPEADTWRPIADAPIELTDATASWTGEEMIVFGAALHGGTGRSHGPRSGRPTIRRPTPGGRSPTPSSTRTRTRPSGGTADSSPSTTTSIPLPTIPPPIAGPRPVGFPPTNVRTFRHRSSPARRTDACAAAWSGSTLTGTSGGRSTRRRRTSSRTRCSAPARRCLVEGVVGRFGEGDDVRLFAYREPSAASPDAATPAATTRSNGTIAFSSGPSADILVVERDGSSVRRLVNRHAEGQEGGVQFAWSPDGSKLAFTDYRPDGTRGLFVMDSDGGDAGRREPGPGVGRRALLVARRSDARVRRLLRRGLPGLRRRRRRDRAAPSRATWTTTGSPGRSCLRGHPTDPRSPGSSSTTTKPRMQRHRSS